MSDSEEEPLEEEPLGVCPGDGSCLESYEPEEDMRNTEGHWVCDRLCPPTPCPNHEVCGWAGMPEFMECHGGRCLECNLQLHMNLDILKEPPTDPEALRDQECPICMERWANVKLPQCTHRICGPCMKEMLARPSAPGGWTPRCPICRESDLNGRAERILANHPGLAD